jgi:hypothetical protein
MSIAADENQFVLHSNYLLVIELIRYCILLIQECRVPFVGTWS